MLVNVLREWKAACVPSKLGLVFPNGAGEIDFHVNIVTRGLAPVQVAAGVVTKARKAKYTGLHALRHFYASWCIDRVEDGGLGLPIKIVQHRLGHSSIQRDQRTPTGTCSHPAMTGPSWRRRKSCCWHECDTLATWARKAQ